MILKSNGYYHFIYSDFYKGGGIFKISHDAWDGVHKPKDPLNLRLVSQSNWTPITINTVLNIRGRVSANGARIYFYYDSADGSLYGDGASTFYIKYLHD